MHIPVHSPLEFPSYAKINLTLRVGAVRSDGYHPLVSWFCCVGLSDTLRFDPAGPENVSLTCDRPDVPCDHQNLVMRAAALLMPFARRPLPTAIHLTKRIPMGGGLGGGSSNAAVALRTLARMWDCSFDGDSIDSLAAELGSDVPFFLHGPSAICRGRGEFITPIAPPAPKAVVLLLPGIAMPTAQVYRRFDEMGGGADLDAADADLPDPSLGARELLPLLVNDLEMPAFALAPQLGELRDQAERLIGRPVRMSGSGSTLFSLYDALEEAQAEAERLRETLGVDMHACTLGDVSRY